MMGGSLEKVRLDMVLKNEQGTFAKIQGSVLKKTLSSLTESY